MQDEDLFNQFINFCESQPEDRVIDHYGSFKDCAIGKFAMFLGKDLSPTQATSFAEHVLGFGELYGEVNCAFIHPELSTYGGYTKLLKQYI